MATDTLTAALLGQAHLAAEAKLPSGPQPMGQLHRLRKGEKAVISALHLDGPAAQRLMEMGFVPGLEIAVAGCAPGGDPVIYSVAGSCVAIRLETAANIAIALPDAR